MQHRSPPASLAAIDIGSNAIRMVVGEFDRNGAVRILKKVREPIRLGEDAFALGEISRKTADRAIQAFIGFRAMMHHHRVSFSRAVATSALREAKNRDAFVAEVKVASGIAIEVIDGSEEARLIHLAVTDRIDLKKKTALLIDIGGGSAELTLSVDGRIRASETFKLGTVRLLRMLEERGLKEKHFPTLIEENLQPAAAFLRKSSEGREIDTCVGTGGNLECLGKLRAALLNRNSIQSIGFAEFPQLIDHLSGMTVKERIRFLRLRPDRADVIVPAAIVAYKIMALARAESMSIPYVGLRDGILLSGPGRET